MFLNRQPKESPDELANRLQKEGKIANLEQELRRYSVSKLSAKDKASYFHLWGICAFRKQDRNEAFRRFKEGIEVCPDSQDLLFSLGQEYEHRKAIDKMFECFDRCSFPTTSSAFMLAAARYAYLWDRPDKGMDYLKGITDAYFTLGIADDHFVYVRGLPFFDQSWNYLVAFAVIRRDFSEADAFINRACQKLIDYDFDSLRRFYECVKSGDYAQVVEALETQLAAWDKRFPSGYKAVQLAALKARGANGSEEAVALLQEVNLSQNDFPWLVDVLTIHKAWSFQRAAELQQENAEIEQFLAKQPMLFEPDHAVSFGFLPYQETLKAKYQNRVVK